jgi:hypothetical protein
MTLTRQHGLLAIGVAAALLFAFWVARNTEWVEESVDAPPSRAMREDPLLRLKRLLEKTGATLVTPDNLDRLPPPGATLVLDTLSWDLFPEREVALQRWVEAGGALVLPDFNDDSDGLDWVPIHTRPAKPQGDDSPAPRPPTRDRCTGVQEPSGVTPAFGRARRYDTCMPTARTVTSAGNSNWALDGGNGPVVLRVPVGRGSVTASATPLPWGNSRLLERDNALIAVAVTQAGPGRVVWILSGESRPPLLTFLWTRGAPALLLAAAALALALWRGAARFGPRIAPLPTARRSMAEQIRGTALFIASRGSPALHAAQSRALVDAARGHIRGFDQMAAAERAQAIAAATRLDAGALAAAMAPVPAAVRVRHPAVALALLETARRRLLAAARRGKHPPTDSR